MWHKNISFPQRDFIKYPNKKICINKKKFTCFEFKAPGHFKAECPKHERRSNKKESKTKKNDFITWDDYNESFDDEEPVNMALMTNI